MIVLTSARAMRAFAAAFLFAFLSLPAQAGALKNPWDSVAPTLFNDEEVFHQANEFDAMDAFQLAAVPTGQRVKWIAPSNCVPASLKRVIQKVAARFGPITVSSTARSRSKNARVGGKSKSYHLGCRAVDFRVHGSTKGLAAFLASEKAVGGIKRYSSGFYHIDNGPRRSW
ncbi:MAG: YcbK family protein [Notoacmeibacter sp.]